MEKDLWVNFQTEIESELHSMPHNFLRGNTIAKTLHPSQHSSNIEYFKASGPMLAYVTDPKIGEPSLGPTGYSQASLQCGYYIQLMKTFLNLDFKDIEHIVDIGGGYGNMYRVLKNMGYNNKYQIIDFPVMHKLQQHFLTNVFPDISNLEQIPLDMEKAKPIGKSLLIATHSINEMPLSSRSVIEPYYSNYDYIFINHNYDFVGINNVDYFNGIIKQLENTHHNISFVCPINSRHLIKMFERKQ